MIPVENVLEIRGPVDRLNDFLGAASGPGVIDWQPDWGMICEDKGVPEPLAINIRRKLREIHDIAVEAARLDPHRSPFCFHALIPIPLEVLDKGWVKGHGEAWCRENWGTPYPPTKVDYQWISRRRARRLEQFAVFRFWTWDEPPIRLILTIARRWPELRFELLPDGATKVRNRQRIAHHRRRVRPSIADQDQAAPAHTDRGVLPPRRQDDMPAGLSDFLKELGIEEPETEHALL